MAGWPFTKDVVRNGWASIQASGFDLPVPGCVYDGSRLDGGIPLGGLGTGYFTLEGSGKIGHCSIYNDIVPPRVDYKEWLTVCVGETRMPLSTAEIAYWGHYPIADLVADFSEKPLAVGVRAFSPFIVGDAADSNIPAALFEINVENHGSETITVELVITPPKPPSGKVENITLAGDGVTAEIKGDTLQARWAATLAPGASQRCRLVLAWYFPYWRDKGNEAHVHRYGARFSGADAVAAY
ncbi:MAG: hypothetical protein LLG44_04810, partial [Chloroflexi bacterium]|nr:hypothetical protein [Chloroflexota bacterium]